MSDTIEVTYGSCIDFDVRWTDQDDDPIDLTDDAVSVSDVYAPALMQFVITRTDPAAGVVHMHLDADDALKLQRSPITDPRPRNWFRIVLTGPDGCVKTTPTIWIRAT